MAGACGCESCCQLPGKGLREGFEGFEGGQTAGSNALKNRWLGRGCESCCQLPGKGLRGQARTPLKTDGWGMWLRELLPVAWERLAGGFEGFGGGQTAGSNAPKNRWLGHVAARVVAGCLGLRSSDAIVAVASDERTTFHTSGGPRHRPGLLGRYNHPNNHRISSAARGGGRSSKDSKPIGAVSCSDARMASEPTDGPKGG